MRVKRPMSHAIETRVSIGLHMHTMPKTMKMTPVIMSQIFVLVFIVT